MSHISKQFAERASLRKWRAGVQRRFKATNFMGESASCCVYAHLTPAQIDRGAGCSVFVSADAGALSVRYPDMTAAQAREMAAALLAAADEADAIDAGAA